MNPIPIRKGKKSIDEPKQCRWNNCPSLETKEYTFEVPVKDEFINKIKITERLCEVHFKERFKLLKENLSK